ncbi:DUF6146 family protein [Wenyingzhuangia sp. IMCC45467]
MKFFILKLVFALVIVMSMTYCSSTKNNTKIKNEHNTTDTIKIVNEEEEYEVIIIDPGFNSWLTGRAKPRNYYSLPFLENKNYNYVTEWNIRVNNPSRYSSELYGMRIDYDPSIKYGYEVNYLLFNYFIYFQQKYNQRLAGGIVPW